MKSKTKDVLFSASIVSVLFLFAIFVVPIVADNHTKEFKVLVGAIIVASALYGFIRR
jgi:positive regulator of sigma E activity